MRSPFFIVALVALLITSGCADSNPETSDQTKNSDIPDKKVEILRDKYGTPHVYADSNYGVYYGYGYALATDRLFQLEMLKRTAEGRVAEVLGEKYLSLDTMIRTSYDHRAVNQQLAILPSEDKEVLEAYAQGFSKRINEVLNKQQPLPKEFKDYDFMPQAWTAYDAAMIFVGAIAHRYSDFNSELDNLHLLEKLTQQQGEQTAWNIFNSSKWVLDPESPTTVPRDTASRKNNDAFLAPVVKPDYLQLSRATPVTKRVVLNSKGKFFGTTDHKDALVQQFTNLATTGFTGPEFSSASNFWAVNKNVKDAKGVLVNGPQFGSGLPSYVYGIGLHGGDFNVVGNTLFGLPSLLFAHNNFVGWGSTAGMSDQVDVYAEKLDATNPEAYFHKGVSKPFESWVETIKVRDSADVKVTARRSVHGMVVQMDTDNGVAYTRARAWEGGEVATLIAWINLAKDRNLDQVQQRISNVTTNINFYYMDVNGNLGFTHGGRYPQRAETHDSRLPVPGTGELDWLGYRPYSDNPTVRNPQQGYIVNWNNRPAENWVGIDLWSYTWSRADRSLHISDELKAAATLSVDDLWAINDKVTYDDVSGAFLLPFLQLSWEGQSASKQVTEALKTLANWDKEWRIDENAKYGAQELLLETWSKHLFVEVIKDDVGDENFALYSASQNPNNPLGASMSTSVGVKVLVRNLDFLANAQSPEHDFFNGKDYKSVLRQTFSDTVATLHQQFGGDLDKWVLDAAPMQWRPYNFRGVPQADESAIVELPAYMNRGSENNLFSVDGQNFTAYDVIPPGQSGYVAIDGARSEHYTDQLTLFADFETKKIPFSKAEVEQLTITKEVLVLDQNR